MKKQNNKINVSTQIQQIKDLIDKFQQGYIRRDRNIIDNYMNDIFEQGNDVAILGTSDGEWCLGFDEAKELVESDWEYWGDVRIDTENPIITFNDNTAWIALRGTVKYEFEDSEERYGRYVQLVKEYFTEDNEFSGLTLKERLTKLKWIIAHTFGQNKQETKINNYPLRITGVVVNNGKWKFRYMQFSLPMPSYPEVRMTSMLDYKNFNKEERQKLKAYVDGKDRVEFNEIKDMLSCFEADYLCETKNSSKYIVQKYFAATDKIMLIDTDETWYKGADDIANAINQHSQIWDKIELEKDLGIINIEGETAWVTLGGIIKSTISENEAIMKEIDNIKSICDLNIPSKDKLFKINRDISRVIMETAIGEEFLWPFRFEGMLIKESSQWKFHSIQFSYPFYYILEGKYDTYKLE
ncbi:hypothetical protein [Brassicibacter mesophilus]|uniref:hypothetical protein n=1 Tax=Brassicibacter mesophilus TaxID=745119 RepID=UPI003D1F972A